MDRESVRSQRAGGVLTLTLDRPPVNAFDLPMTEALLGALEHAAADPGLRCLVLTGAGRAFSAGQDVDVMHQVGRQVSYGEHLEQSYNRIVRLIRNLEAPVLAAVNGPAAGAGLGIALAADLRLAAESARFAFGFTTVGLTADSGVALLLPALVGLGRALEMALCERPLSASQALQHGLVLEVLPDDELPLATAALAGRLAQGPTRALALTKRLLNRAALPGLEEVLRTEAELQEQASRTEDHREGLEAFVARRPPQFRGA